MKTFTVNTPYSTYEDCYFVTGNYMADNSLSIQIWNDEDGPIADMTRCLCDAKKGFSYLDMNNCPWSRELVERLGIGTFTGQVSMSGFCTYPLYEFDMAKIKEYSKKRR